MRFVAFSALAMLAACEQQARVSQNAAAPAANRSNVTVGAAPLGTAPATKQAALKLMHDRHEGMEEIGDAFKLVSRELKGGRPDLTKVRAGAGTIARLAPQVTGWFPPGTGPDVGKTRTKVEVWQKSADFAAKRNEFQGAAKAFNAAVQGSDLAAIRTAHANLGKSCKSCHDPYRTEKKEHE